MTYRTCYNMSYRLNEPRYLWRYIKSARLFHSLGQYWPVVNTSEGSFHQESNYRNSSSTLSPWWASPELEKLCLWDYVLIFQWNSLRCVPSVNTQTTQSKATLVLLNFLHHPCCFGRAIFLPYFSSHAYGIPIEIKICSWFCTNAQWDSLLRNIKANKSSPHAEEPNCDSDLSYNDNSMSTCTGHTSM